MRTASPHSAALWLTALLALCAASLPARADTLPGDRTIAFYNIHNKETLRIAYKRGGKFVPEGMKQINWILRDWRRNEPTEMDPKLIDILWEVHAELGSKEPIHIISGYRSPATNAMLRQTTGGQATKSRHMIGSAADVHFPDVPVQRLRYSALIREQGGVGYYPTSALPFVHIDTGSVRAWPRLPRKELALLFPSGDTEHRPADGGALSKADVARARASGGELVAEIDAFHRDRQSAQRTLLAAARLPAESARPTLARAPVLAAMPSRAPASAQAAPVRMAAAAPPEPAPRLATPPRLIERPSRLAPPLPALDRKSLFQLASLVTLPAAKPSPSAKPATPQAPVEAIVAVAAPEFDDDHPEELTYRPFPIGPYLTATPSIDDPTLAGLVAPDPARTLELLNDDASSPGLQLRPGLAAAKALWRSAFDQGRIGSTASPAPPPADDRRVATAVQ